MNLLYILLQAAADPAQPQGSGMQMILMLVLFGVVFYFFMIRPQQKRQKELQEFRNNLTPGAKVVTSGGVHGTIKAITDTTFVLTISQGVDIAIEKAFVVMDAAQDAPLAQAQTPAAAPAATETK